MLPSTSALGTLLGIAPRMPIASQSIGLQASYWCNVTNGNETRLLQKEKKQISLLLKLDSIAPQLITHFLF